jgi:glycosyltransferase involved in cell wall biosynthesis
LGTKLKLLVKISIITVVYNGEKYLKDCIDSVLAQDYTNIEYILIDGCSTDNSFVIAKGYEGKIPVLISEKDQGMYDALNKGIALATGDVIGILNADDVLANSTVISSVAALFHADGVEAVYGDLNYVAADNLSRIQRKWRSQSVKPNDLLLGWMPAHPTLYLKKHLFEKWGGYQLKYGSAADYELMFRMFYKYQIKPSYLPEVMVSMRNGGMSNQTLAHRWRALKHDFAALKDNGIVFALPVLAMKKLRKIKQFF